MMLALVIMPIVILTTQGGNGVDQAVNRLTAIDPDYLSMFKGVTFLGWISAVAWGLGYFGQPHIIVRFMAVRSVKDVPAARRVGMSWMIVSLIGAVAVGIFGRAYAERTGLERFRPRNHLHPAVEPAVPSAGDRLPICGAAGGDHVDGVEPASGRLVLADRGHLSHRLQARRDRA
jgi:Na+/proline symporter